MINCSDCKRAKRIGEQEYERLADQYDIDNKTCYVPRCVSDEDEAAFRDIHRIAVNSDFMNNLMKSMASE